MVGSIIQAMIALSITATILGCTPYDSSNPQGLEPSKLSTLQLIQGIKAYDDSKSSIANEMQKVQNAKLIDELHKRTSPADIDVIKQYLSTNPPEVAVYVGPAGNFAHAFLNHFILKGILRNYEDNQLNSSINSN